jgi:uroporphyrinogen III methyltransferase/synthase
VARGFLAACDEVVRGRLERDEIRLVAISRETGRAVREAGFDVAAEARTATTEGLIRELIRLAGRPELAEAM